MEKEQKASLSTTGSNLSSWCWSHLPPELLDQIYALLSPSDRPRFRLICSTWRGVAKQSIPRFPLPFEPPRLLLSTLDNGLSFFDIFNCKSLSCSIPAPHNKAHCFGYLAGWFFLVSDQNPSRACLFNPVLLAEIPLPDLDSPIIKAILSAAPGFPNCLVAVMRSSGTIALCEPAGKRWQVLDLGNPAVFWDIIFWRNQLCGIVTLSNVLFCNFDMESGKTSILSVRLPPQKVQVRRRPVVGAFLVESTSGDLLAVIVDTPRFSVFKWVQECTWENMERIGNQALFLGTIRSESVPVNQFLDSGVRKNSIYCTKSRTWSLFWGSCGVPIVYSMEDEEDEEVRPMVPVYSMGDEDDEELRPIGPVYPQNYSMAEPVWISPVIWP